MIGRRGLRSVVRRGAELVSTFPGGVAGPNQRRPVPRVGLRIGRAHWPFRGECPDRTLALLHAELRWEGEAVVLRALRGTRLNGEAFEGERTLVHGDVLRCGDSLFVFVTEVEDGPPQPGAGLGDSVAMRTIRRRIGLVATRPHHVVVTGESGTGKEVVARLLHQASGRKGPFVAVDCGALSPTLVASDLFGHVRGAFVGAVTDQTGLFRSAAGGTLLLDELANLPMPLQPALLRVLDDRRVRPVGSLGEVSVDVRVVATSQRDPASLVREGRLRPDLYARVAQWTLVLRPLRDRRDDLADLTAQLLLRHGAPRALSPDLCEALLLHDWPHNVRGLSTALALALDACPDGPLGLAPEVVRALRDGEVAGAEPAGEGRSGPELDRAALEALLGQFRGRVAAAARHVGVNRTTLYRLLWASGLDPASFRSKAVQAGPQAG